jgi:hypothetical protein
LDWNYLLENRIKQRKELSGIDVQTRLKHFALINYAVPKERLLPFIPQDRFILPEFSIDNKKFCFMSAVPFLDIDFFFPKIFPFFKFSFFQTNFRVYVIEKKTGEHSVWFFGTTLGSKVVNFPKYFFKLPWHFAKYKTDINWNQTTNLYDTYKIYTESNFCSSEIILQDTALPVDLQKGFQNLEEQFFILTHPIKGYFYRTDNTIGTYSIWHDKINIRLAKSEKLYFSLYENLGILSKEEMNHPHSIFICPEVLFEVHLPPKKLI